MRRARVPVSALVRLAEADAFLPSLRLARREALWAIKGLRDNPLPLFAAADAREGELRPEFTEPTVNLKAMTAGRDVVEDYGNVGLTLRAHPIAFLRERLQQRKAMTCRDAGNLTDGRKVNVAGLVLVRQMPASAKGVMFLTLEDETGVVNLVVWPTLFEEQRRVVLGSTMMLVEGKVQREGEVVHIIARRLHDLSVELRTVGKLDAPFSLPHGRGDEARTGGGGPDSRTRPPKMPTPRDIYLPDLHIDTLKVKSRDFR